MSDDIDMPAADADAPSGQVHIDEDLHSRQLAVYGKESMRRMASSDVLIIGLGGLGVEVVRALPYRAGAPHALHSNHHRRSSRRPKTLYSLGSRA